MTQTESLTSLYSIAKRALLLGGDILRRGHTRSRKISYKTPLSPVTQVDLESEKRIVSLIRKKFPSHQFLAEESAFIQQRETQKAKRDVYRWVIDPLDGTVNFIHRIPQFCVSVAVERNGKVLVGGIMDPIRKELFLAVRGKGSRLNNQKIRVSGKRPFRRSLLITGFPYDRDKNSKAYLRRLSPFLRLSGGIRRFGSAALDLAWVACGRADGYWESGLKPWDVAAGWLLVTEGGGRLTRFNGRPYRLDNTSQTLASNGAIHRKMVSTLNQKTHL